MLNSFTYGSTKYNSLPIRVVIPPTPTGGGEGRKVVRKKFRKELFNLIGQKLFFCDQKWDIIGTPLLLETSIFGFNKQTAYPIQEDFEVFGKCLKSSRIDIPIQARKLFEDKKVLNVQARKMFGFNATYDLNGRISFKSVYTREIAGRKKFFQQNESHIKGKKDITNILTSLDLFDEE